MKKVFIAVSPGFYKTKLFNELNKEIEVEVIYTSGYDASTRNADFMQGAKQYEYRALNGGKLSQCLQLVKYLCTNKYDEVILGGYTSVQAWTTVLFSPKKKNACMIESTCRETVQGGWRGLLKKIFFSRLHRAYVPGSPHEELTRIFGFKGEVIHFKSVGLFNNVPQPPYSQRAQVKNFLFVGRLLPVKNLEWLIERFEKHLDLNLTIVGFGPLEEKLKSLIHTQNIKLTGAINNKNLPKYYQDADVFILPSITETWGLVIEEALNNGTPIMCSHMVGSADDLVKGLNTGVVFQLNDINDFEAKLKFICSIDNYNELRKNVSLMNFDVYEKNVKDAFLK